MANLSNKKIEFTKVPISFRLAAHDVAAGADDHSRHFGIKEIQRRAFERGVEVERAKYSTTLSQILGLVQGQAIELDARMNADREKIEGFAVRLALEIAENLTRSIIDAEAHDVVKMVKDMMNEVDPDTKARGVTLKLHPRDHAAVVEAAQATQISLEDIEVVSDSSTALGSPMLKGGDTHYYADMTERLAEIRSSMIEESLDA